MTRTHQGYIEAKNAERGMLANAVEHFLRSGGQIELHGNTPPVIGNKVSPRSVADHSKDDLIAERVREHIARGAGTCAIRRDLKLGSATLKRICTKYGVVIQRKAPVIARESVSAQKARRDGQLKKPLAIIKELAATGSTIEEMASAANVSRSSVIRWISEYSIKRGPKMDLST